MSFEDSYYGHRDSIFSSNKHLIPDSGSEVTSLVHKAFERATLRYAILEASRLNVSCYPALNPLFTFSKHFVQARV
jgi:hypothetical protein